MLQANLPVVSGSADVKRSTVTPYRASHLLIEIDESFGRDSIRGTIVEIQIASIASHVLNEVEHDIAYKDHGVPATASTKESLTEVFHATRLLDTILARLLDERSTSIQASRASISSPEELRHWLERRAKRALNGDFLRLFRLLDAAVSQLTGAALEELGHPAFLIDAGRAAGRRDQNSDVEDATAYGLMPKLGLPFRNHASTWRGPSTEMKHAILGSRA